MSAIQAIRARGHRLVNLLAKPAPCRADILEARALYLHFFRSLTSDLAVAFSPIRSVDLRQWTLCEVVPDARCAIDLFVALNALPDAQLEDALSRSSERPLPTAREWMNSQRLYLEDALASLQRAAGELGFGRLPDTAIPPLSHGSNVLPFVGKPAPAALAPSPNPRQLPRRTP